MSQASYLVLYFPLVVTVSGFKHGLTFSNVIYIIYLYYIYNIFIIYLLYIYNISIIYLWIYNLSNLTNISNILVKYSNSTGDSVTDWLTVFLTAWYAIANKNAKLWVY
jgi:hypothetical protein